MRRVIQNILRDAIAAFGWPRVVFAVDTPEDSAHGDYASNAALLLARELKEKPTTIAERLKEKLASDDWRVEIAAPGFVNFFLNERMLAGALREALKKKEKFGGGPRKKESIIIEYSSPNIAKPMGVHHLRSTIIGQALVNIYAFLGWRVLAMSFPGDWGTQFGALIAAYKRWGDRKKIKQNPIAEMLGLYVRFNQKKKDGPTLKEEARREFRKLEDGDKENRRLWQWFREESFKDFDRVYEMLGVKIPHTFSESFYEPMLKDVIDEAVKKGVATRGIDGSLVIFFDDGTPPLLIQKSDAATLYATRDLAQMQYRVKRWHPAKITIVVANQQTLHFEQVFRASELLGYAMREQLTHVKFGMMLGPGGKKFATREGKLIPLEDVLKEAVQRARNVVEELNQKLPARTKEKIAKAVGIGAVKYADLHQHRQKDVIFDWDRMLSLKGDSAPYLQYTYARLRSILRKTKPKPSNGLISEINPLSDEKEWLVVRHLVHFPEVVEDAACAYEPHRLAQYLYGLAERANAFYEALPVLQSEGKTKKLRLAIVQAAAAVLKSGLNLLGIEAPERM